MAGTVISFWIFPPLVWVMQARMLSVLKRNVERAARAEAAVVSG